ncbi:MAG: DUF3817 domain-containing protein [Myxococcota bacterium]
MMDFLHWWAVVRTLKFLGLSWFLLGVGGATMTSSRAARLRATYLALVPGFVLTYASGWGLMKLSGRTLLTPWLLAGAVAGLGCLHLAFMVSHRQRSRPITPALTWGCVSAGVSVMTLRPEQPAGVLALFGIGLGVGSLGAWPFARTFVAVDDAADEAIAWNGLRWLTWLEGASLVFMVLVAMPWRAVTGTRLDGGTGLIGWSHGVLVLVFAQSLSSTLRLFGWSQKEWVIGVLSSLVPGGSFWFEWRLRRRVSAGDPSRVSSGAEVGFRDAASER